MKPIFRPGRGSAAFTLLEALVTLGLILILTVLSFPSWKAISRSRSGSLSVSAVMDSLDLARTAAVTTREPAWVIFRTGEPCDAPCDALRVVVSENGAVTSRGAWQTLPRECRFTADSPSLLDQEPPAAVAAAAMGGNAMTGGIGLGSVQFQSTGAVAIPRPGGPPLRIGLTAPGNRKTIILSRGTGRAACE